MVDESGRVHTSLNINTETGRLSSQRPNLQNQPALEKDVVSNPQHTEFLILGVKKSRVRSSGESGLEACVVCQSQDSKSQESKLAFVKPDVAGFECWISGLAIRIPVTLQSASAALKASVLAVWSTQGLLCGRRQKAHCRGLRPAGATHHGTYDQLPDYD